MNTPICLTMHRRAWKRYTLFRFLIGNALLLAATFTLCVGIGTASGTTYLVNSTGDGVIISRGTICDDGTGHCTLRAAIQATNNGAGADAISFRIPTSGNNCDALGNCTINLGSALPDLRDGLTISGPGANKLTVQRDSSVSDNFRIFNVTTTGTVSFSGLTIAKGLVLDLGAGIQNVNSGTVNVTNCTISGNLSYVRGGGIANSGNGTVNVTDSTLSGNSAPSNSGGGILNNGTLTVTSSTLSGNSASGGSGGGIYSEGTLTVTNSTLSGNSAAAGGGIDLITNGTLTVTNSTLSGNSATNLGGGILNNGTVTISNSTLSGNSATGSPGTTNTPGGQGSGGGIYNVTGTVTISNSTLSGNSATGGSTSSAYMAGPGEGGAIFNSSGGTLNVTHSTLSGNSATGGAGASGSPGGGPGSGGAIYNTGASATLNVINSTLSGNSATGGAGLGSPGGQGSGGGISGGTLNVTNSTLSGNLATGGSGNTAGQGTGGGILGDTGTATIKNTIIASNTASTSSPDVSGSFSSQRFNLIGKNDGAATSFPAGNPNANNDIVGTSASPVDPKLDPNGLQNNGGPTDTIALLSGSPAIDKGTSASLTNNLATDQRGVGYSRTVDDPSIANAVGGDGTDIGAFEFGAQFSAVSSKTHGPNPDPLKTFGINLPLTGTPLGVECRRNTGADTTGPNVGHDHELIVTFASNVTVSSVDVVNDSTGFLVGTATLSVSNNIVTVDLHNIPNPVRLGVNLRGVSDGTNTNDVSIPMGVLLGDTTGDTSVNSADISQTKSQSGHAVSSTNFRNDVTVDGSLNSADISLVKSKSGTALP